MTTGKNTYLWEVKAASYGLIFEKEQAALAQLNKYLAYDKEAFKVGDARIKNGTTSLSKVVNHGAYTEYVTYTIEYQNAKNGLILYHFTRHVDKREENTVPVTAPATEKEEETLPSRATSAEVAVVRILDAINTVTSSEETITATEVIALIELAVVLKSYHEKVLVSEGSNTVSLTIVDACSYFISKVTPLMLNFTENAATIKVLVCDFLTTLETCDFDILTEELEEGFYDVDEEEIEDFIKAIQGESEEFDKASEAQPPRDPLIIDLGASGIELHSLENGVNFDLDNNGFAEKTAWTGCEDGFLALDRNENGNIDNGGELFGDQVILNDGSKSASGFEVLSELDENKDAVIDNEDSVFDNLVIWIDANHNGMSESEELKGLNESGIKSISLEHTEISFVDDETGARVAETANVELDSNGVVTTVEISEFWFPVNSSDTTQGGTVTAGNVPDIMQAIRDDETGKLFELCCEFSVAEDIATKRYYLKQILYYITDASDVIAYRTNWNDITIVFDGSGEAGLDNDSADKIVIDGFFTSEDNRKFYLSFDGLVIYSTDSSSPLRTIYGTSGSDYMQGFDNGNFTLYGGDAGDTLNGGNSGECFYGGNGDDRILAAAGNDTLNGENGNDYLKGGDGNDTYVFNIGSGIDTIDDSQGTNIIRFGEGLNKDNLTAYRTNWNDLTITFAGIADSLIIQGYFVSDDSRRFDVHFADGSTFSYTDINNPVNQVRATEYDDYMSAWSDEGIFINGCAGNDNLTGGAGNDIISGGIGNDTLLGKIGDDTYKFSLGDGSDNIMDIEGMNTIIFGDITSDMVTYTCEVSDNTISLMILITDTNESIVIKNYSEDNYRFKFADEVLGRVVIDGFVTSFVIE